MKKYIIRIFWAMLISGIFHIVLVNWLMHTKFYIRHMEFEIEKKSLITVQPLKLISPQIVNQTSSKKIVSKIIPKKSLKKSPNISKGNQGSIATTSINNSEKIKSANHKKPLTIYKTGLFRKDDPLISPKDPNIHLPLKEEIKFDPYHILNSNKIKQTMKKQDKNWYDQKKKRSFNLTDSSGRIIDTFQNDSLEYGYGGTLNEKGIDITPWAKEVIDRILETWKTLNRSEHSGFLWVLITFKKSGTIANFKIKESSKNLLFNSQIKLAVLLNAPYPDFPKELKKDELQIEFKFTYEE